MTYINNTNSENESAGDYEDLPIKDSRPSDKRRKQTKHDKQVTTFIGLSQLDNATQWYLAFERSMLDFLPLFLLQSPIEIGIANYTVKIIGGFLTFGLLLIALRRKFERRFRH